MGINHWENPGAFYITAIINSSFSAGERETYREIVSLYDSCFQLAKQSKIAESRTVYEQCCRTTSAISPRLRNWILAFYGQRLCYYHHKSKQYNNAITLTAEILASVRLLQQQGYAYLFFVEVQQQLNLGRIYFELNQTEKAIRLSTESIHNMHRMAGQFNTARFFNNISEDELIQITQYGMIVEVLSDTCNKLLFKLREDPDRLERTISLFIESLQDLNFGSLSPNPQYECIDRFISLMRSLSGFGQLQDDDILFFINSPHVDKKITGVINNYINLLTLQSME